MLDCVGGQLTHLAFPEISEESRKNLKVIRTYPNIFEKFPKFAEDFIYPLEVNHRTEFVKLSFRMLALSYLAPRKTLALLAVCESELT